eukprot:624171-Prorocentrum_minimum.AAC.1
MPERIFPPLPPPLQEKKKIGMAQKRKEEKDARARGRSAPPPRLAKSFPSDSEPSSAGAHSTSVSDLTTDNLSDVSSDLT